MSLFRFVFPVGCSAAALSGLLLLVPVTAGAQLAQNMTVGNAKALALGHAVTADPPGIDAIHYNPAGLALLQGRQYQFKLVAGLSELTDEVSRAPYLETLLAETAFEETLEPGTSTTRDPSAMLPFFGLTELPAILSPLGGVSLTTPDQGYTFATAVYAPLMVGYRREDNSVSRYQGNQLGFTHLTYFSPSIAWRINDDWYAGVSFLMSYSGIGVDLDMRVTNEFLGAIESAGRAACDAGSPPEWRDVINLCEGQFGPFAPIGNLRLEVDNGFNPSLNAGLLWQPSSWFSWGLVYQMEASTDLEGEYEFRYEPGWVAFFRGLNQSLVGTVISPLIPQGVEKESGTARMNFVLPAHVATGISVRLYPDWKLNIDIKWTDTAAMDKFVVEFDESLEFMPALSLVAPEAVTPRSLEFPLNYQSTWSWAAGIEYQYDDQWVLRGGFEDRPGALPDNAPNNLAPFGDAWLLGMGVGYRPDEATRWDLGFAYFRSGVSSRASADRLNDPEVFYNPYAGYDLDSEIRLYLLEISYQTRF
ncbi:MAG: outer membrane protein transport protein [Ketobacteraceae bacterium]|nr:outer membrane protein transport protein [Ketobacteraceae bacterium]